MNANMQKVVEALRSGEFAQTHLKLRDDTGYCVLGVISEIFRRETGRGEWRKGGTSYVFVLDGQIEGHRLLDEVRSWAGLTHINGTYNATGIHSLSEHNDNLWDFDRIADTIESEPPGLLVADN